jgi:hypothetical protein
VAVTERTIATAGAQVLSVKSIAAAEIVTLLALAPAPQLGTALPVDVELVAAMTPALGIAPLATSAASCFASSTRSLCTI